MEVSVHSLPARNNWKTGSPFQFCFANSRTPRKVDVTVRSQAKKDKVLFVMGATGTGKSKLSVELADYFPVEIINSDKIQVYKGLNIVTNKVSEEELLKVTHHLISFQEPDTDFPVQDFCHHANVALNHIASKGCLPIIVGGSNNYIKELVEGSSSNFKSNFDSCFLWMDVALPVLCKRLASRIDEMVEAGFVDEIRGIFDPAADYSRGIRRAIGVPEMDQYLRAEMAMADDTTKKALLETAIAKSKENTYKLVTSQLGKIKHLMDDMGWKMHRIDATVVHEKSGEEAAYAWRKEVLRPTLAIVKEFR
ncbi:hypothetical protein K2173_005226 [Erythroxylum novogranatense]|uniref:adenylate dimethylallyltransferase (ADP/ATP-dependent) n=1 Tax=Erythroxylum novogranatense TaxID=1862640 RepID=A0AAV8TV38_9ROSI|nr:hypothetical protein K2173_005226 [Erythroxylum novogranatense]